MIRNDTKFEIPVDKFKIIFHHNSLYAIGENHSADLNVFMFKRKKY